MGYTGIIPARYASTRFPGKPLAMIGDKPMIQWVYEQCLLVGLDKVVVATDDSRIKETVLAFGGQVVMTSSEHPSGTDRCGEAARLLNLNDDEVVINIQGDEPFIHPEEIRILMQCFENPEVKIATLVQAIDILEDVDNKNIVKVVSSKKGKALYFSRSQIPFPRQVDEHLHFDKHIGIYAYKNQTLQEIVKLPESSLEKSEKLEQLRWLENDLDIYISHCHHESIAIDTPEDLEKAIRHIKK